MGKTQQEASETTDKQISSNTKCNSNQIVVKTNERPEWLPDGWNVDFRTRKSGPNMGHGYKCYINPLGKKFYSKLEVFRYLESIKGNACTSKMEEDCKTMHSPSNDAGEKSKTEKYVAEKSTIGKSVAEKSAIGKSVAEKSAIGKSVAEKSSVDKPTADNSTDADLPPGWIKEVKIRKSGNSNKKDVFYTDPVSGYVFCSKKDALRYIESGDISSCAIKPKKRQILAEDKLSPTSAGKKQKKEQSATKRQLFVGESDLLENGVANPPKMQKTSDPDDVQESRSNHSLSKKVLAHRSSRRLAGVVPDQLTNNLNKEQTLPVPRRNLRKDRTALDSGLSNKSYQQLNGIPETRKVADNKINNLHNSQRLASDDRVLDENKLLESEVGKSGETCSNLNKFNNKKGRQFPCRSSKRLAGFEAKQTSDSLSYERAPEYKSKKSKAKINADLNHSAEELVEPASINGEPLNKSRKYSRIPPVTHDELEKHDNMNDGTSEPQQSFAFHYSWSDPSLEFAINTLTSTLPVEDPVLKSSTVISKADKFPENNLSENVTGSSKDKRPKVNSSKSKNKKEPKTPTRLSKRLAGHEPDVSPAERAVEYSTRKSSKDKTNANVILSNGESAHIHAEETKLMVHASDKLKTDECGDSVPDEKLQRPEAEITNDERSEPQFPLQFGDSWSDPCVEFAIKTLTGALPVDGADRVNLPVVTTDANNDPPNKEMPENMVQDLNEAVHDNSNHCQTKEELNTVCPPSKQLLNQPELKTSTLSYENDPKFVTQESCSVEGNITMNLDGGQSLHTEGGNMTQIDINTLFFDDSFMEDEQLLGDDSITEKPQPETETANQDNTEREFCASFMDSWSDPCLAFAFKTLTGALPEEENIAMQGSFQEPANNHGQRDESSKFPGQQAPMNLNGCTGADTQKHYSQWNNNDNSFQEIGSSSISQGGKVEKSIQAQQAPINLNVCTGDDTQKHYSQWNNYDNSFQEIGSSSISQGGKVEKSIPGQQAPINLNVCTGDDTQKHYSQWNNYDNSFQRR